MATYKVLQDVEAEDKLIGPLTLRQFIYAGISAICLYLSFLIVTRGLAFLLVIFLPPAAVFGFLAFPWGRDQPTEIWALAKIRFLLKPRKRIWDQSGAKELVTVTAPPVIQKTFNTLSETEVKSRLRALADTIDSRGWAVKSSAVNMSTFQPALVLQQPSSDRLLNVNDFAQQVSNIDVQAADDMLDELNNPRAQKVNTMIAQAEKAHRQKIIEEMNKPEPVKQPAKPANNYWFLNEPSQPVKTPKDTVTFSTQVVTPGADDVAQPAAITPQDEANLVQELEHQKQEGPNASYYGHLRTIKPLSEQKAEAAHKQPAQLRPVPLPIPTPMPMPQSAPAVPIPPVPESPPKPQVTPAQQAAILQLAGNNDLNVATIAREAKRAEPQDEVVIKLH